jgi:hypothetical protein
LVSRRVALANVRQRATQRDFGSDTGPLCIIFETIGNEKAELALAHMAKLFLAMIAIVFFTLVGAFVFAAFTL